MLFRSPEKLYPLWYTPILPLLFWVSAIAVGLAMTIFESWHSSRAFGRALELPLLLAAWHFELILIALLLAVLEEKLDWFERVLKAPMLAYASALALMFFCIEVFGVIDASIPFVYFQF